MTFQIFKKFMLMGIFFLISTVSIHAQEPNMQALIGQSLSKLQQPTPENFLNCVAEMKRIDDMFLDSIQPKFQMVLQSLNFSVMNPHAPETENLMAGAEETIAKMEKMRNANHSDICTLRGFLFMVRIVQNPVQNGQRYYLDVMQNYEKALKLNPDNRMVREKLKQSLAGEITLPE